MMQLTGTPALQAQVVAPVGSERRAMMSSRGMDAPGRQFSRLRRQG